MSRNTRIALMFAAIVVLALVARMAVVFARYSKVEKQFVSVQIGEPRASVIAKVGRPNYHEGRCGVIHFPDKACAVEYVYSHPFAPLIPEYYVVSFSSDGRVIEADKWDSP